MARKSRIKPYEAVAFTNKIKQVINPGDEIIAVTKAWGDAHVNVGRYLGLRRQKGWGDRERITVVVEYDKIKTKLVHNVTGAEWDWNYNPPGFLIPVYPVYPHMPWDASLEEKQAARAKYDEGVRAYNETSKERIKLVTAHKEANYHEIEIPYKEVKTLQRNRIYPIAKLKEIGKR